MNLQPGVIPIGTRQCSLWVVVQSLTQLLPRTADNANPGSPLSLAGAEGEVAIGPGSYGRQAVCILDARTRRGPKRLSRGNI